MTISAPAFVVLKAFGDLTIAATSLEKAADATPRLLLGAHLVPLAQALNITIPWSILATTERDVPAMYDVRRFGVRRAMASVLNVRSAVSAAMPAELTFDRAGLREGLLAFPRRPHGLPAAPNIYIAYQQLVGSASQQTPAKAVGTARPLIGIFPGSRVPTKNIPASLVDAVVAACAAAGWRVQLFLLDGERPDLLDTTRPRTVVPRNFDAMLAAIERCDAVVSADSLPAHLAERTGRPIFVFSPVPNVYWLPLSAYEADHHALFADGAMAPMFERFITLSSYMHRCPNDRAVASR